MTRPSRTLHAAPHLVLLRLLMALFLAASGLLAVGSHSAHAGTSTSGFRGVNWADKRDNFVNGVLYPSGLTSSDTHATAAVVAERVVGQLHGLTGSNTVRMPVNEPTVNTWWGPYSGAIDGALGKGKVILSYWAYSGGKPAGTTAFYQMWDTVVETYGADPDVYFEVINEPYGYSTTDLNNLYHDWLNRYPAVPRDRVILDGAGLATNVAAVGGDTRLDGTLLAVHYYTFFVGDPYESENEWANGIASLIGNYADRTIATEWGGPMGPGSKNGVSYDSVDYSVPSGSFWADYLRGVSSKLRALGVGSVYWPGLRDGDWYSLTTRTGEGSAITLSVVNPSGLARLQYAWGTGTAGSTTTQLRNVDTGLDVDGMGRTASGSATGQWKPSGSANQQWIVENYGAYVRLKNGKTGLYLDSAGLTTNGSQVRQYADTGSTGQQWSVTTYGNTVLIKNRATGMYLDGMGRTTNGADLGQWAYSKSTAQQWRILPAS
ncbi:RICIN domain-containing protein [Kitasatospora phosalacinea]|uniref:RICIN domain-containing protein n=1 Tax=Kitasatospora phosalacinea TaxID=2065 RepID=UPI000A8D6B31|nr:RICIN domain-containing protein [Kitasatospora phosalacinea]